MVSGIVDLIGIPLAAYVVSLLDLLVSSTTDLSLKIGFVKPARDQMNRNPHPHQARTLAWEEHQPFHLTNKKHFTNEQLAQKK